MLDPFNFRIVAGILLVAFIVDFILILITLSTKALKPFLPAFEMKMPLGSYILWRFLMHLPLIVIILIILFPKQILESFGSVHFLGDTYLQIIGIILYFIGGIIFYFCCITLGRFMVPKAVLAKDHELITTGPFSKVRHPTYTSYIMINLGVTLFTLNLVLVIFLFFAIVTTYYKAMLEEELLASEKGFGQEYKNYMKRTGRFLPRE